MRRNVAVIGSGCCEKLFNENVPVGKSLIIRGKTLLCRACSNNKIWNFCSTEYQQLSIIPFDAARQLGANIQLMQVYVEAASPDDVRKLLKQSGRRSKQIMPDKKTSRSCKRTKRLNLQTKSFTKSPYLLPVLRLYRL